MLSSYFYEFTSGSFGSGGDKLEGSFDGTSAVENVFLVVAHRIFRTGRSTKNRSAKFVPKDEYLFRWGKKRPTNIVRRRKSTDEKPDEKPDEKSDEKSDEQFFVDENI